MYWSTTSLSFIHHCFFYHYYYDIERNIITCIALYNTRLHRWYVIQAKAIEGFEKDAKGYGGWLFGKKNISIFEKIGEFCWDCIEVVICEFKDNLRPIVEILVTYTFIKQVLAIFRDV